MNKTDRDFAESLVLEVQKRPAVYVPSHPDHKDRYKIDLEWTSIAAQLHSTGKYFRYSAIYLTDKRISVSPLCLSVCLSVCLSLSLCLSSEHFLSHTYTHK